MEVFEKMDYNLISIKNKENKQHTFIKALYSPSLI